MIIVIILHLLLPHFYLNLPQRIPEIPPEGGLHVGEAKGVILVIKVTIIIINEVIKRERSDVEGRVEGNVGSVFLLRVSWPHSYAVASSTSSRLSMCRSPFITRHGRNWEGLKGLCMTTLYVPDGTIHGVCKTH